ncbi:hypothetical protein ASD65_15755 [Microbacterium sp. Root61]|uniref:DUF305 domain-containing protein n=1 Tax=Microbacterium sp. Root61 TaxID=1736570 RepID=UPI0006F357DF|nr:DUF305 domain-containing protein [Microbacterium sp. Root61]KRA25716.1 hypothetical protein ASD65_15755 [Microbacterium sp. Root61]
MRRPVATASAVAVFLVCGALFLGIQLTPAAPAAATRPQSAPAEAPDPAAVSARDAVEDIPNDADMMFASMMIPHHQQAVELSRILAATDGIDDVSIALAAFIDRDQTREITDMQAWLDAWHRSGMMSHDGNGFMAGMATPEQIAALEAASDVVAEKLFLELMIAHHQGALLMTTEVLREGNNSYIRALAKHIAAEQEREIEAMTARRDTM